MLQCTVLIKTAECLIKCHSICVNYVLLSNSILFKTLSKYLVTHPFKFIIIQMLIIFRFFINLCQNYEIANLNNMQIKNMKWKVISRKSRFVNKTVVPRLFTRNYETTTYMKQILASIYLPSAATLDFEKGQNILER